VREVLEELVREVLEGLVWEVLRRSLGDRVQPEGDHDRSDESAADYSLQELLARYPEFVPALVAHLRAGFRDVEENITSATTLHQGLEVGKNPRR
jgi:hypothetical protein